MASGGRLLGAAGKAGTGGGLEKILRVNIGSPSDVTSKCTSLKEICQGASEWSVPGGEIESQKLLCSTLLIDF